MKRVLVGFVALAFLFTACDKDKDNKTVEEIKLEGTWQIKKVEFLTEDAIWPEEIDVPGLGYAPKMYTLYLGYEFFPQKTAGGEGSKLTIHNLQTSGVPGTDYWAWNYSDDKKSFSMAQLPAFPAPHDFSVADIKKVVQSEDGEKLTFEGKASSKVPGESPASQERLMLPVKLTLVKGEPTVSPDVYILGEKYVVE